MLAEWPTTPSERLNRLMRGHWVSQAVYVMAELGIADLLVDGPRSPGELADATRTHAATLARVLRLLAAEGLLSESEDGRFELTEMGSCLREGSIDLLRARFLCNESHWRAAGALLVAVRTGESAFELANGAPFFEHLRANADEGELFDALMTAQTVPVGRAVAATYDFSALRSIVDVGGGRGGLAIEVLKAYPELRAVVFDQDHVAAEAESAIAAAGLADRCSAVGGDFFAAVPAGADAYLLKFILHDWDDARSALILERCAAAMAPGGRVLVVELLVPPGNRPSYARTQDINMLINLGGQERSRAEFGALFAGAGLRLADARPISGDLHILEAVPRPTA